MKIKILFGETAGYTNERKFALVQWSETQEFLEYGTPRAVYYLGMSERSQPWTTFGWTQVSVGKVPRVNITASKFSQSIFGARGFI